jgi:putative DNA primase/helicase
MSDDTSDLWDAALDARLAALAQPGRRARRDPTAAPAPEGALFPHTDSGNAEFFAAQHGAVVRYDHARGRWLLWRHHRWQPDADEEIRRLAKLAMRQRSREALDLENQTDKHQAVKWAIGSESRSRIEALLFLAQAELPIANSGAGWDRDPWLLGVPNGVVDLRNGTLRDGRPEDLITMATAVPFDAAARCPRWERFMAEVFDNAELVTFVQAAIGYSLTGETGEQCLFMGYGTGANGKGTLLNTLAAVLGDYAYTMPFSTIELHQRSVIPNDLAALVGRRFVISSETTDGTRLNESRIKALTGCDPITARFLHAEYFTFTPVAKFWLAVNHKPVVRDDSHGFWRRMRLLPFLRTFAVDPTLAATLRAEAPGILAWAVRGGLAWQRNGLLPPKVVTAATDEYERDSDPLALFIDEALERDQTSVVAASDLYAHYQQWAVRQHMTDRERLNSTNFGRKMSERFTKDHRVTGAVYCGIARRFPADAAEE